MGLLDEAIRDHLELKRRRGADASEIARLEHDALGPVRREPFGSADSEPGPQEEERGALDEPGTELPEGEYDEEEYYAEEEGDDWVEPFADEGLQPRHSRRGSTEAPGDPELGPAVDEALERHAETGTGRWRRARRAELPPEDAPPPPSAEPDTSEHMSAGEETVEYRVDDALAERRRSRRSESPADQAEIEDEGDVLEETPEFLQDAPEHDRLWFEQRPPRDFDFDD